MSQPREPSPAKLVIRFLFHAHEVQALALRKLEELFGPLDFLSPPAVFPYTTYYNAEMGEGLMRQTASYVDLVAPDSLPEIKLRTNEVERLLSCEGRRQVNIDPGLLSEERFVLATGKNFTHRIYLRDGIFADLTLMYERGEYRALPWTYPDYQEPDFLHFLGVMRKKLKFQRGGRLPR